MGRALRGAGCGIWYNWRKMSKLAEKEIPGKVAQEVAVEKEPKKVSGRMIFYQAVILFVVGCVFGTY